MRRPNTYACWRRPILIQRRERARTEWFQYAGVSESLRLQEGAAHGAGERRSRLVGAERVLTPRRDRFGNRRGPVLILAINFFGSSAFPGAGFCFIGGKGCELQVSIRTPLRSSI
jgi:hypothetical protein